MNGFADLFETLSLAFVVFFCVMGLVEFIRRVFEHFDGK